MPDTSRPGDQAYADKIDQTFPSDAEISAAMTGAAMAPIEIVPRGRPTNLYEALAAFQANYPVVRKGADASIKGKTKDGREYDKSYKYADLADIHELCMPLLGKLGLAWTCKPTWSPAHNQFGLVYALVFGPTGECDEGFWPLPDPNTTAPQQVGSAATYGRRYSFCGVTGIAPAEDDDDAAEAQDAYKRRQRRQDEEWERGTKDRPAAQQLPAQAAQATAQPASEGKPATTQPPKIDVGRTVADQMKTAADGKRPLAVGWYPAAWRDIVSAGLGDKPSPWKGITWAEAFGRALAASIEAIPDLRAHSAFTEALGKSEYPWAHQGIAPAGRLDAVKARLQEAAAEAGPYAELEQRMAAATSWEQLEATRLSFEQARHLLSDQEQSSLETFWQERNAKLPQPPASAVPAGGSDADPWATAKPVESQPAGSLSAAETAEIMSNPDHPDWAFEGFRLAMRTPDATDSELSTLEAQLDPAFKVGAISQTEATTLYEWLKARPWCPQEGSDATAPQRRDYLLWLVQTAVTEAELDDVRDANNRLRDARLLAVPLSNKVAAGISARRREIKQQTGSEVPA